MELLSITHWNQKTWRHRHVWLALFCNKLTLARDQTNFLEPNQTAVPRNEDAESIVDILGPNALEKRGLFLPDTTLLSQRGDALESILPEDRDDLRLSNEVLIQRGRNGFSLLEEAAYDHRNAGENWWLRFVTFVARRFPVQDWFNALSQQKIWPIEGTRESQKSLAAARGKGVPTLFRRPRSFPFEQLEDTNAPDRDDIPEIPAVPLVIANRLAFLDESCIPMTEIREGRVCLRSHAEYLSPRSPDKQLVRPPRVRTLVNEIIAPFFRDFVSHAAEASVDHEKSPWEVLAFLIRLVVRTGAELTGIHWTDIAVPACLNNGTHTWRKAGDIYLSSEWLDLVEGQEPESLLREVPETYYLLPPNDVISSLREAGLDLGNDATDQLRSFFVDRLQLSDKPKILTWPYRLQPAGQRFINEPPPPPRDHPDFKECWRNYFEYLSQQPRGYDTTKYEYEIEVHYIDGCAEIGPEIRKHFFRRIANCADHYNRFSKSSIRKQGGNSDTIPVQAFWCYALGHMESIPCYLARHPKDSERPDSESLGRVENVWILDRNEIRAGRDSRYQFVSFLPEDIAINESLWGALDLRDFSNPKPEHLVQLLLSLSTYAIESFTTAVQMDALRALVRECWEKLGNALQTAPNQAQAILSPMFDSGLLLLEVTEEVKPFKLTDVNRIIINDDPDRYGFFSQQPDNLFLPLQLAHRREEAWRMQLAQTLTNWKGELFVRLSTLEGGPRFEKIDHSRSLRMYLETDIFPGVPIWEHLFIMYSTAGINPVDPTKDAFRRTRQTIDAVEVVEARFADDRWPHPVFLDYPDADGRRLLAVNSELASPRDILVALAPLFGSTDEAVLGDYASQVRGNMDQPPNALAAEEMIKRYAGKIRGVEQEIRAALSAVEEESDLIHPVALAARHTLKKGHDTSEPSIQELGELKREWSEFVAEMRGQDRESIVYATARNFIGDASVVDLLLRTKTYDDRDTIKAWDQWGLSPKLLDKFLIACGQRGIHFSENQREFDSEKRAFVAAFMGTCAVLASPPSHVHDFTRAVENLVSTCPSDEIMRDPYLTKASVRRILQSVAKETMQHEGLKDVPPALERLLTQELGDADLSKSLEGLVGARVPTRVVEEYLARPSDCRSSDAHNLCDDYIWAISRILQTENTEHEEILARVKEDLSPFVESMWANPLVILNRFGEVLASRYPKWDSSRNQALFRQRLTRDDLRKWLLEGGYLKEDDRKNNKPTPEMIKALGMEMAKDKFKEEAARGAEGVVWKALADAAEKKQIDPLSLIGQSRRRAEIAKGKRHSGGSGSGGNRPLSEEDVGAWGELFVYLQICNLLAQKGGQLDDLRWVSGRSRERFGMEAVNDNLGYDLEVIDRSGIFGERNRTCFIEVKATTGDGSGSFRMSLSEWLKAEEYEKQNNCVYIIARVAHVTDINNIEISAMLENPRELLRKGILACDTAGFYVWCGQPEKTDLSCQDHN